MEYSSLGVVAAAAVVSSFCSGLMGIGGGIVMAPLLLYAPQALSLSAFPVKFVAGLTMAQDLVGSFTSALTHRQYGLIDRKLVTHMGVWIAAGALAGGVLSRYASARQISAALALFVSAAALSMAFTPADLEERIPEPRTLHRGRTAAITLLIGLMAGFVGQGSAFLLIPAMLLVLRLPTRATIANALAIVFCASAGGFVGKWGTNQVSALWILLLMAAAVPAARIGVRLSHRISPRGVRAILTMVLLVAAIQMWRKVLSGSSV